MVREMYHTQEKRNILLLEPIICTKDDAWLGDAYYFWYDLDNAHFWGIDKKSAKTGYFEVYHAEIDCENVLDTVFNEEHYIFWSKNIDNAIKRFKKAGISIDIKGVNEYFKDNGKWTKFDGILFQDVSTNKERTVIPKFYYKKRIQIGIYDKKIITNFALRYECAG